MTEYCVDGNYFENLQLLSSTGRESNVYLDLFTYNMPMCIKKYKSSFWYDCSNDEALKKMFLLQEKLAGFKNISPSIVFYDNLKSVVEVSDKVKYFLKEKGIIINKISLRHHDDVSKLYKLLRELSVSNHDTWSSLFLFSSLQKQILEMKDEIDIVDRSIRLLENYALQYEITIKNYYSKKDAISILL